MHLDIHQFALLENEGKSKYSVSGAGKCESCCSEIIYSVTLQFNHCDVMHEQNAPGLQFKIGFVEELTKQDSTRLLIEVHHISPLMFGTQPQARA